MLHVNSSGTKFSNPRLNTPNKSLNQSITLHSPKEYNIFKKELDITIKSNKKLGIAEENQKFNSSTRNIIYNLNNLNYSTPNKFKRPYFTNEAQSKKNKISSTFVRKFSESKSMKFIDEKINYTQSEIIDKNNVIIFNHFLDIS